MPIVLTYGIVAAICVLLLGPGVISPWLRAIRARTYVPFTRIFRMWTRRLNTNGIVDACIMAATAGLEIDLDDVESHAATGGRFQRTVLAAVAAHKAGITYDHRTAIAADLAGRDAVEEVNDLIAARRAEATTLKPVPDADAMIGESGVASSPVGSPGIVMIRGRKVSAVSKDGPIPKGAAIRVIQSSGGIAVVERISHTEKG
jgi:hypothetical protein